MSALEHGAGTEEAMSLLARLDRLAAAGVKQESRAELIPSEAHKAAEPRVKAPNRTWLAWGVTGAVLGIATVAVVIGITWVTPNAWFSIGTGSVSRAAVRANDEPVPVPSAADVWLARAQAQKDRGHLRNALVALDAIGPGDKRSAEADKLRAEIQGALLAAGRAAAFSWTAPAQDGRR
jgi:hypothetical protein